jgi:glycosyltransferase involved in cell wall biosynthesis
LRYNSVVARGDLVLADSRYASSLVAKYYSPVAGKIRIIPQGIDRRSFAAEAVAPARVEAVRRQWQVAPHERIVLIAGPIYPGGSYKILIEAARLLSRSGLTGVKFILESHEERSGGRDIDRAIAREGLQGIAYRAGHCDAPAALLAAAIVVVLAAEARAFGAAAAQAQAMGTPVIAANLGAAPEIILAPPAVPESARTGFLVPPGDAAALAVAIATILSLGATAVGKLSSRAINNVETRFSLEHMCAETLKAYGDVRAPP